MALGLPSILSSRKIMTSNQPGIDSFCNPPLDLRPMFLSYFLPRSDVKVHKKTMLSCLMTPSIQ